MFLKKLIFFLLLCALPVAGNSKNSNENAAVQLVRNYYQFLSSQTDMPNAEFRAGDKFDYPETGPDHIGFEGPGGDGESYEIVDENYKVVKIETKKDHENDKSFDKDDVIVTVRFKTIGVLNLFKDSFEENKGIDNVVFYCSKFKGKYYVSDLNVLNIRFYKSAVKYLENGGGPRGASELAGLKKARGNY